MNESIRRHRELTMTVVCMCEHQYGAWRPRCPACGTATPEKAVKAFNPPRVRQAAPARESKTTCIFCRQRGAKERCARCNELIHRSCIGLHDGECEQFQLERNAALVAAGVTS